MIAVLHDINMAARYCDYLVALRGEVIAQGNARELMRSGETLEQIYGSDGHPAAPGGRSAGEFCLLMENSNFFSRRRLLIAMALSPLLWQMRGARAAERRPAARGRAWSGRRRSCCWRSA